MNYEISKNNKSKTQHLKMNSVEKRLRNFYFIENKNLFKKLYYIYLRIIGRDIDDTSAIREIPIVILFLNFSKFNDFSVY